MPAFKRKIIECEIFNTYFFYYDSILGILAINPFLP